MSRVLLIRQEIKPEFDLGPGQDLMESAFKLAATLRIDPAPEIVSVSLPAMPPPDPMDVTVRSGYRKVEPGFLTETLKKDGPFSLVVSLLGEPAAAPPAGLRWPPIICFSWDGSTNLAEQLRAGVVVGAVASRHARLSKGGKDWFDLRYTVVDRGNVDPWMKELPARH